MRDANARKAAPIGLLQASAQALTFCLRHLVFIRFMLHFGALDSALTIPVHCRMKNL